MTEDEAKNQRDNADRILSLLEHLKAEQAKLARVNARVKAGSTWSVSLTIDKDLPYGYRELEYKIPVAHVQQQLVDEVNRIRRRLISLGWQP